MQIKKLFLIVLSLFTVTNIFSQQKKYSAFSLEEGLMKDNNGNSVNAHGAGILKYKNTYYLFGEIKKGRTWLVPHQNWEDYRVPAGGISCYSSKDLLHWKYEGIALSATTNNSSNDIDTGKVIERPKVIYNEKTKKFVMWMHIDNNQYSLAHAGIAVSDNPAGPYHYIGSMKPNHQDSRDMTLFKDDDGKAYIIYSSENNMTMHICLLSGDYLSPSNTYKRILINEHREAPAIFKYKNKYYLITSLCTGWDANKALLVTADSMMGKWTTQEYPFAGNGADITFNSQSTFIVPVKKNEFIFMADRWLKTDLEKSTYLWLPFKFEGKSFKIKSR